MDSALKGKSWAGNIYHHFESICQDVDGFISKDTVKFVENLQVQSVGTSIKRLYTNMVEDVHPPCKDADQATTIVPENKLSENQEPIGSFRKTDATLPIGVETDALLSRSIDEDHENSTPILHEQGLNTEDHKNNSSRGVLIDSILCMDNDPKSDESRCRPYPTVSKGSSDSSACDVSHAASGIKRTLCDISFQVESFDETKVPTVSKGGAFSMNGPDFVGGLMEKPDKDGLSEIETSLPSETDDTHLDMETIDLTPDMKHDESSVILHDNSVYFPSRGKRNFIYYKKLIQDALTSRKRLSKEYKRLGILYGDIEFESSHNYDPIRVPSVHTVTSQSSLSETEWELV